MLENRIRSLREAYQWTQEQLANRVGVTRQTILFIEKGKYVPSLPLALKLSKVFQQSVNELFWLQEDEYPEGGKVQ